MMPTLRALEHIFLVIYVIELTLRTFAYGWENLKDNWFLVDLVLVTVGCAYTWIIEPIADDSHFLQQILLLRTLRLLRLLRALRHVPFLKDAWALVHGLLTSTRTMLSTLAMLMLMLYIFACIGLELITKDVALHHTSNFFEHFG